MYVLPDGTLPAWRLDCPYQQYLRQLLFALAERYRDDPRLLAVELRGLDRSWGEMYYNGNLKDAQQEHGFTPQAFETWAKRYIDDAVAAFNGQERKVIWLRQGGPHTANYFHATLNSEFQEASKAVTLNAYEKGLGRRDGGVEVWTWYTWNAELYGQRVPEDAYLEAIEDFSPLRDGRMWYTENEIVQNAPYLWPDSESERVWPIMCLRALQMRCNWVWIDSNFYERFDCQRPGLNRWFELSLGKSAQTSADAWSWLREGYVWGHDGQGWGLHTIKNFERWLFQRDVEGDGRTVNADWFNVSGYGQWISEWYFGRKGGEWHARRTDSASGQNCIYFRTSREFMADGPHDVQVKVTYLDAAPVTWRVEYASADKHLASPAVTTAASGQWRTATIGIPAMYFRGSFSGKMDFRMVAEGPGDLTVKLVRIIDSNPRN